MGRLLLGVKLLVKHVLALELVSELVRRRRYILQILISKVHRVWGEE